MAVLHFVAFRGQTKIFRRWDLPTAATAGYIVRQIPEMEKMTRDEFLKIQRALGKTCAQIAELLGVHAVTVRRWRCGDRAMPEPTARLLRSLAREASRGKN